ncbi:two-component system chemotaxis response regulator CheV [Oxalobacteraceae bacterium GrIS 1.11]
MSSMQQDVDERTSLTGNNKFELFLFRLGTSENSTQRELFGINVFKVREIMEMPQVTAVAGSHPHMLGVVNIRGQIVPVIDLPMAVGCTASNGLRILMVTEFARSTQAFAVEEVDEIVRLEWNQVLSAEQTVGGGLITSIARLDGDTDKTRLAQVLDVEQILRNVLPSGDPDVDKSSIGPMVKLAPGTVILAADDSSLARSLIEQGLTAMGAPYIMTKTGKEAWEKLQSLSSQAIAEGKTIKDKVALVLTDLEMPEMDGFTLTRNIKTDARFADIPVVIHSSLTGSTNEDHVKGVGADGYVAKFVAAELAATIRKVLSK